MTSDKVIDAIREYYGTVIRTSLSETEEAKLCDACGTGTPAKADVPPPSRQPILRECSEGDRVPAVQDLIPGEYGASAQKRARDLTPYYQPQQPGERKEDA